MSPQNFKLCMSMLSSFLTKACEDGYWSPLQYNNSSNVVSHMTFTDDIVIFGEAFLTNVRNMLTVVDRFCNLSGQRINYT